MLDALIRQLPGVELKADGRIMVNGEYVESLLLNGEDFFANDNSIMLENLPAYAVKNLQVYKKDGKRSEMMGIKTGDEELVMDVKLKKQYSIGWLGNVEVAGGTSDRYFARLFATRFTEHSRLSAYGMVNNVNEVREPGEDVEWKPENVGDNTEVRRQAGIDYLIDDKDQRYKLSGTTTFYHNEQFHNNNSSSVNFLSGGDTYGKSHMYRRVHLFGIFSSNNFDFNWDKVSLNIRPQIQFTKSKNRISTESGIFNTDPLQSAGGGGLLDSLFRPDVSAALLAQTINRTRKKEKENGIDLSTQLLAELTIKIPHTSDNLDVNAEIGYGLQKSDDFTQNLYDYPTASQTQPRDFRNAYNREDSHKYGLTAQAEYMHLLNDRNWYLSASYKIDKSHKDSEGDLYRLDWLEGWGEDSANELGDLPSVTDWKKQALDGNNSSHTITDSYEHTFALNINKFRFKKNFWSFNLSLPLTVSLSDMDYVRPTVIDTSLTRNVVKFNPSLKAENYWITTDSLGNTSKMHRLALKAMSEITPQDLIYKINLPDTSDPLSIRMGNPNLHSTWKHTLHAYWQYFKAAKNVSLSLSWLSHITQRALCMGYTYNRQTGRQTFTPDNVNGNWDTQAYFTFTFSPDKKKRLTLSGNTIYTYNHNVDLIAIEGENDGIPRSTVGTHYLSQDVKLTYNWQKLQIGAKAGGTWSHAASRRADFTTINAGDFNYGLLLNAELLAKIYFATDFTVYSRRGYADSGMNDDNLVWNARLSRTFWGKRLSVSLEGFDLLHQLSNVRQALNGQGRTETSYNVIPRYAMLHLIYRFNVLPMKK